jgi:hypothetical protein
MKLTRYFFLSLILLMACTTKKTETAVIRGHIDHASGESFILQELDTKEIHHLDSWTADADGRFIFHLLPVETGFYLLKASSGKVLVMILGKNDTIDLGGDFADFPDNIILRGNKDATLLDDFFAFTRKNEKEVDSLEMLLVDKQDSAGYFQLTQSLDTAFQKIWYRQKALEEDFISKNPGSMVSLIVLNYSFGMSPVLSPEEDFGYYLLLDSTLSRSFSGNKHVVYHHQRVKEYKRQAELKKLKN